jgi:hypothetical protein
MTVLDRTKVGEAKNKCSLSLERAGERVIA